MTVDQTQRFRRDRPCPICDGYDEAIRGKGKRCFGYLSDDGDYAHCTREEQAGSLSLHSSSRTFAHHLVGDCECGKSHDPGSSAPSTSQGSKPRISSTYSYTDEAGGLLFQVVRYEPKGFRQRRPNGQDDWIWNLKGTRRVPYNLPELQASDPGSWIFVVEGEKDVDGLRALGLTATTNPGGVGKWKQDFNQFLKGRKVAVIADNDTAGHEHAEAVAKSLLPVATAVRRIRLPDLPEKGDVSTWLGAGHTAAELIELTESAEAGTPTSTECAENDAPTRRSQADKLVELVEQTQVELFSDSTGDAFARMEVDRHYEIHRCRSKRFQQYLARLSWNHHHKVPNSNALSAAMNVIEARASYDGRQYKLHNRVASHDGAIWYDLTDADWRAVKITPDGWEIVAHPPVLFTRYAHQQPQVEPQPGGDLTRLFEFVNLRKPEQQLLFSVYVVSCLVPGIPHPIPTLHGPQGSTKTTALRCARKIVDPSATETLTMPRNPAELVQQLAHHWMPIYDNITSIPPWISDMFCRATTGDGFSKRQLYTDDDDFIYQFRRCCGLNGINVAAYQPDLLDRCILFGLDRPSRSERRPEKELWDEFESARPRLVGAALDALSGAMRVQPTLRLRDLPRMADFASWGAAIAEALDRSSSEFLDAYENNHRQRNEEVLVNDPVASALLKFVEGQAEWEGLASDLLAELIKIAGHLHIDTRAKSWPKAAHALTRRLNVIATNLADVGVLLRTGSRTSGGRLVQIERVAGESVISVTDPATSAASTDSDDATCDAATSEASSKATHQDLFSGESDGVDANDASSGDSPTRLTPGGSDLEHAARPVAPAGEYEEFEA